MSYSVVDLFAGAGGLSLGFVNTKKYAIKAFVEINQEARETYMKNHPNVDAYEDVIGLDYNKILEKEKSIDVVIGGPPCQGFSTANRQNNQLINMNNQLVKEYVRAICELKPRAFLMENVKTLKSNIHMFYYTREDEKSGIIEKYGIPLADTTIALLSDKLSSNEIFDVCHNIKLLQEIKLSDKAFNAINRLHRYIKNSKKFRNSYDKYKKELNFALSEMQDKINAQLSEPICNSYNIVSDELRKYGENYDYTSLIPELQAIIKMQKMMKSVLELEDKKIIYELINENGIKAKVRSYSVCAYIDKILSSDEYGYKMSSGVLNAAEFGAPQKRKRYILIGVRNAEDLKINLPSGTYTEDNFKTVRDAIGDLENVPVLYDVDSTCEEKNASLESMIVHNHIVTKTSPVALARFSALKQGQNFRDLKKEMKENTYTDPTRTQMTIYQRLNYDEPSGTVLNVRKSMWIHPTIDRAISIREAARLQTFPDDYIFCGVKNSQYQQIGNAVPPILGEAIAEKIAELLEKLENK